MPLTAGGNILIHCYHNKFFLNGVVKKYCGGGGGGALSGSI